MNKVLQTLWSDQQGQDIAEMKGLSYREQRQSNWMMPPSSAPEATPGS
jgi:hypothetical protein